MEKEVTAHHYLANIVGLVEKIAKERDHLVFLVITFKWVFIGISHSHHATGTIYY